MRRTRIDALIALGSNLGDRRNHVESALSAIADLPDTRLLRASRLIETAPLAGGEPNQRAYLNAAAIVETRLKPRALLDLLLQIERDHGRTRKPGRRWASRTLDLDLVMYDTMVLDTPGLTLPHPRMHERRFVLEPCAQIAPWARHPVTGMTVLQMLGALRA
ncbi:MAG: 2-amino-4-hydroxy-6-hydroxymethyldihydropteridine diphosphokinase [Phycisphaerales bacterium]|nr:2-amino-4-hydroxy-6-hydroxymethyldihydropteridine diphosphokinase [Phycisphaerales bacterium]